MVRSKRILIICFLLLFFIGCLGILITRLDHFIDAQQKTSNNDSIVPKFRPTVDPSNLEYVRSLERIAGTYDEMINVTDIDLVDYIDTYRDADGIKYSIERNSQVLHHIDYSESEQTPPEEVSLETLQVLAENRLTALGFSLENYTLDYAGASTYGSWDFKWIENNAEGIGSTLTVHFFENGTLNYLTTFTSGFSDISEVNSARCQELLAEYLSSLESTLDKSCQKITDTGISYRKLSGNTLATATIIISHYDKSSGRQLFRDLRMVYIYY